MAERPAGALLQGDVGVQGVTLHQPGTITPFTHQIEQRRPGAPYRTCNILYRREVLDRLGGFDGSLRWYADNILGLRARQLGGIAFASEAVLALRTPRPREIPGPCCLAGPVRGRPRPIEPSCSASASSPR